MASSLFTLLDDIALLLDDVAVLSKVAAKKTAGVLGDDLALNAEQVSGVRAERELPIVWAVAKGSLLNKVILAPAAILISLFVPWLVTVLLVIGGLYLCFEGVEKVLHSWLHSKEERQADQQQKMAALMDPDVDLVALEKDKIRGAIRTDFILSAEIIVIVLGTVTDQPILTQAMVVAGLSFLITVCVYGIVALIVKLDDMGLLLLRRSATGHAPVSRIVGRGLLTAAPMLMKFLSIAGTLAMFLVGGGILLHSIGVLHHLLDGIEQLWLQYWGMELPTLITLLVEGITGFLAGTLVLAVITLGAKLKR